MTREEAEWSLADCRRKIDSLDLEIRRLLNERAEVVEGVIRAKDALAMPILEQKREDEVVRKVITGNPGPLPSESLQRIYEQVMVEMRNLQVLLRKSKNGDAGGC